MTRAERKQAHRDLAAWCRAHGVTPAGAAWEAAKEGCRDSAALRALNVSDGWCPVRPVAPTVVESDPVRVKGGRPAASVREGDILTGHGLVVSDPVTDPETGSVWITVVRDDGSTVDLERHATDTVTCVRPRRAPAWIVAAAADYRNARDAWEADRESNRQAPSSVPGTVGTTVSMCQLEPADYAAACPRPRYADFVKEHAARLREPV